PTPRKDQAVRAERRMALHRRVGLLSATMTQAADWLRGCSGAFPAPATLRGPLRPYGRCSTINLLSTTADQHAPGFVEALFPVHDWPDRKAGLSCRCVPTRLW